MATPNGLVIRAFVPADQEPAKGLSLAGLSERWDAIDESLNPDLDDLGAAHTGGYVAIAERDGELVGVGVLVPRTGEDAEIHRMSVCRSQRRSGIGAAVLAHLVDVARARGFRRAVLETSETWTDAAAFYEPSGFQVTGTEDGDFGRDIWSSACSSAPSRAAERASRARCPPDRRRRRCGRGAGPPVHRCRSRPGR